MGPVRVDCSGYSPPTAWQYIAAIRRSSGRSRNGPGDFRAGRVLQCRKDGFWGKHKCTRKGSCLPSPICGTHCWFYAEMPCIDAHFLAVVKGNGPMLVLRVDDASLTEEDEVKVPDMNTKTCADQLRHSDGENKFLAPASVVLACIYNQFTALKARIDRWNGKQEGMQVFVDPPESIRPTRIAFSASRENKATTRMICGWPSV